MLASTFSRANEAKEGRRKYSNADRIVSLAEARTVLFLITGAGPVPDVQFVQRLKI